MWYSRLLPFVALMISGCCLSRQPEEAADPHAQLVKQLQRDVMVLSVQIGLRGEEEVEIPRRGRRIPRPCRAAAERGAPVVGRRFRRAVAPDVPITPRRTP